MVTAQPDGLAYTLLPTQEAATHQYHPVKLPGDLLEQANRRLSRLVNRADGVQECAEVGRMLYDQLVPAPVRDAMRAADGGYVLLSLQGIRVPWELLHDGLGFWGCRYSIGRSLPAGEAVREADGEKKRALLIVNPASNLPAAEQEGQALLRLFRAHGIACDYIAREQATLDEVLLRLGSNRYDFIHYCGHVQAEERAALILHDGQLLDADAIGRSHPGAQVVFLNGCEAGDAHAEGIREMTDLVEAFARAGARAVIGPMYPVADEAAYAFAISFYQQFLRGVPAGMALSKSRSKADTDGSTWMAFVLYGDPALSYLPGELKPLFADTNTALDGQMLTLLSDACRYAHGSRYITTAHVFWALLQDEQLAGDVCGALKILPDMAAQALEPFIENMNGQGYKGAAILSPNTEASLIALREGYQGEPLGPMEFFAKVLEEPDASLSQLLRYAHTPAAAAPEGSPYEVLDGCVKKALCIVAAASEQVNSLLFLMALAQQHGSRLRQVLIRRSILVPGVEAEGALPLPPVEALSPNLKEALDRAIQLDVTDEAGVLAILLTEGSRAAEAFESLFDLSAAELLRELRKGGFQ